MEWLTYDVPPGHHLFREIVRCDICGTAKQQAYLQQYSGLTREMQDWTFENTSSLPEARQAALAIVANPQWFFTLTGAYGLGKTRLLACIVNAGRAAGWTSVYLTTAELLDHLRAAYAPGANVTYDGVWDKLTHARIMALDELDRWNPTAWAQEKFFELVDIRYRNGMEQLTVFATNADLDSLPGYVMSRIQDRRCRVFEVSGMDMRKVRT